MNRVCSVRRSASTDLFFEEARTPVLAVEATLYERVSRWRWGSRTERRVSKRHLMDSVSLADVDLLRRRFMTDIEIDMKVLRDKFGRDWRKAEISFIVCDDTNRDGFCSDENYKHTLSIPKDEIGTREIPPSVVLDVWANRNRNFTTNNGGACDKQISPIVFDTKGDGINLVGPENGVYFDLDNKGAEIATGWTTSFSDDAFLVRDINRNGKIDNGGEMFGTATLLHSGKRAQNGYEALIELDSNDDGVFDGGDLEWENLRLWFDRNQDGQTDRGELVTLNKAGVVSISLDYVESKEVDRYGNQTKLRSVFRIRHNGTIVPRLSADIWFNTLDDYGDETTQ